jgi:hypothetical protein
MLLFLLILLTVVGNVNEVNASNPDLLAGIDLVNGGFRDLR